MLSLDATNAEAYLRDSGRLEAGERVSVERLTGGVSNEVLYVSRPDCPGGDFVLKQAREQLRVEDPWFCTVDRVWREVAVLRICERLLAGADPAGQATTPRILFTDEENYCFAMTAAPREHVVWKQRLLEGEADGDVAAHCGTLLAALHGGTWHDAEVAAQLDDRRVFDELRLDPYYRTVARRHPDAAAALERLVDSVWAHRLCLVHADFSPKNLLVFSGGLMMVDFETGHFGDPAFDLGFFLSHLVLKAFYHAGGHEPFLALSERFWEAYRAGLAGRVPEGALAPLEARAAQNFAGCAWARLDGKSPVEYLDDPARRDAVRSLCRTVLSKRPPAWNAVLALARDAL